MAHLKYTVISSEAQYEKYCRKVAELLDSGSAGKPTEDEIELLTVLIEKWDNDHNTFESLDPIELLQSFMEDHQLKAKDIAEMLGVSKGLVSNILNYKKGLSKDSIRVLANRFKVSQEAFNRPYILKGLLKPDDQTKFITGKYKTAG
jgi:HTH-type transcriptional regulator / antitoxin HigA